MKQKTIEGVGIVNFRRSKKSKYVRIQIKGPEEVVVVVPWYVSFRQAERFVSEKQDWIKNTLSKQQKMFEQVTVFDHSTDFSTRSHRLVINTDNIVKPKYKITASELIVILPESYNIKEASCQEYIRNCIIETWRHEAKQLLPDRLELLAQKHNMNYSKVSVRNSKTRWGSCSAKNNISLSLHLVRLPDHLIDYVLLHELAHTVVKNHQKQFHKLLDLMLEKDNRPLSLELRNYKITIF